MRTYFVDGSLRRSRIGLFLAVSVVATGCNTMPTVPGSQASNDLSRALNQTLGNVLGPGNKNILSALKGTCSNLKSWTASVGQPSSSLQVAQLVPYVQDAIFQKHFGKRYDELTVADFREAQRDHVQCQREGSLTPAEQQLTQRVWNQGSQPLLVQLLQKSRTERAAAVALAEEIDALPATEAGYNRLDAIRQAQQRQRNASGADDLQLPQRISQAEDRIALPVLRARVDRAMAEQRQPADLSALVQLDGQVRASRLSAANAEPLRKRLHERITSLDAAAAQQERAASPLLQRSGTGLEQVAIGKQWTSDFLRRYQAVLGSAPALTALQREVQTARRRQLAESMPLLTAQAKRSGSQADLDALVAQYLTDEERSGGDASALMAEVQARSSAMAQTARNRQVFGDAASPSAQVVAQAGPSPARPTAPIHRCDQVAADPDDPLRVSNGVADEAIKGAAAVSACTQALKAHPNEVRFAFQLGRAYLADGKPVEAVKAFTVAAQAEHPGAMVYLGMAIEEGAGGATKDPQKGKQLQELGMQAGYGTGRPIAVPAEAAPADRSAKADTTTASLPGRYNMPHMMNAIYFADASKLDKDAKTNTSYLLAQARALSSDPSCRMFLTREVDNWSTRQAQGLVAGINPATVFSDMAKGFEFIARNPTGAAVAMGANDQYYANLPEYAVTDLMEFANKVGSCNSQPFNRYVANLRAYLNSGTTAGRQ